MIYLLQKYKNFNSFRLKLIFLQTNNYHHQPVTSNVEAENNLFFYPDHPTSFVNVAFFLYNRKKSLSRERIPQNIQYQKKPE
jgi:hypothetical protein